MPTLMTGAAIALAFFMLTLDLAGKSGLMETLGLKPFTGAADSALTLLSTIAGSMITVVGTVFSVTLVALTLAFKTHNHIKHKFLGQQPVVIQRLQIQIANTTE